MIVTFQKKVALLREIEFEWSISRTLSHSSAPALGASTGIAASIYLSDFPNRFQAALSLNEIKRVIFFSYFPQSWMLGFSQMQL